MPNDVLILLVPGVALSALSKVLQVRGRHQLGNLLVVPAAALLTLAVLNLLPVYQAALGTPDGYYLAGFACGTVLAFQLLMLALTNRRRYAAWFLIPLTTSACGFLLTYQRLSNL